MWIEIKNINNFLEKIRNKSFELFLEINNDMNDEISKKIEENNFCVDDIITEKEVEMIVLPFLKNNNKKYRFTKKSLDKIIENLNSRIISNSINKLASIDIFEVAYDNDLDDFVFWIKK
jgi:hypothetical protein